jgi:hypothetical protein
MIARLIALAIMLVLAALALTVPAKPKPLLIDAHPAHVAKVQAPLCIAPWRRCTGPACQKRSVA